MSRFLDVLRSGRVLLMDGAMGTQLQRAGLSDENAINWNLLHPRRVAAVHRAYRQAGAAVLLTNTFSINAAAGLATDSAWCAAFDAIGPEAEFRLAAVGPLAGPGQREFDDPRSCFVVHDCCRKHVADGVLLETCSTPRVRLAIRHIQRTSSVPILLSLTYLRDPTGRLTTYSGHAPEWFARRARQYGVAALGVNCGRDIDMNEMIEIVRRYRHETDLPLFARPNAGTPTRARQRWVYPLTPRALARQLPELLEAGVAMVGGCCGTTPAHIAAMRPIVAEWNRSR